MKCPERYTTKRLLLRRPMQSDASRMFTEYAGDPAVGEYLAWPIHQCVEDTKVFLAMSDDQWDTQPGGPYLVFTRDETTLIGSTGFTFESPSCASTGYVIAHRHWGRGYATESLRAIIEIAAVIRLLRLYALCHPDHSATQRVLHKCGFRIDTAEQKRCLFPNQSNNAVQNVYCFVWIADPCAT